MLGQHVDYSTGTFDSSEAFKGTFHDFRVWDHARSAGEIELNYQQKLAYSPAEATAEGLMANWQFDGFNGSNEVVDIVTEGTGSENNLSTGHATGTGFVNSTPVEDLHVEENSNNGTSVGFVVPNDPDAPRDIVNGGGFNEVAAGSIIGTGGTIGDWTVAQGSVDVGWSGFESGPLGGQVVDLHGSGTTIGGIEQTLATESGRQYQVVFAMSGNWAGGDAIKDLRASAGGESQDFTLGATYWLGDE